MLLKTNSRIEINKIDKGNFFYLKKAVKSALLLVYFVM